MITIELWNPSKTQRLSVLAPDHDDSDYKYYSEELCKNRWGDSTASFKLKRNPMDYWPDLEDNNRVVFLRGPMEVWHGEIEGANGVRGAESSVSVECVGTSNRLKNQGTHADYSFNLDAGERASAWFRAHLLSDSALGLYEGEVDDNDFEIVTGLDFFPGKSFEEIAGEMMQYNAYRAFVKGNLFYWLPRKVVPTYYVNAADCEQSNFKRARVPIRNWVQVAYTPDGSVYGYVHPGNYAGAKDDASIARHGKRVLYLAIRGDETDARQVADVAIATLRGLRPSSSLTTDIIRDANGSPIDPAEVEPREVVHVEGLLSTEETVMSASYVNESNTWEIAETKYSNAAVTMSPGEESETLDVLLKQLDSRFL